MRKDFQSIMQRFVYYKSFSLIFPKSMFKLKTESFAKYNNFGILVDFNVKSLFFQLENCKKHTRVNKLTHNIIKFATYKAYT